MGDIEDKSIGLIRFFRSEYFVLVTFVAIIIPLMAHTAHLLLKVSSISNPFYAYFFAFSFDLAIFAFSINGRKSQATGLAFIVFTLNVCFFNLESLSQIIGDERMVRLFVTIILSAAGSWIVHSYVVFFNQKIGERKEIAEWKMLDLERQNLIHAMEAKAGHSANEIKHLKNEIVKLSAGTLKIEVARKASSNDVLPIVEEWEEINFPFTCGTCEHTVPTPKSLEGMIRFCKEKNCKYRLKDEIIAESLTQ